MISESHYNDAVKSYARNIFRFVFKNVKNKEATDDLVQDCYLKLWQNRDKVDGTKIKSWLFSVAHHAMINYLKAEARKTGLDTAEVNRISTESSQEPDLKELIERALQELPPLQRSVILLRDYEGYNYKEIGDILQLSESQVKVYLFRGRQRMKDSIKTLNAVL
jgi:RNA polymerase sigma factor (sigma-70 family)